MGFDVQLLYIHQPFPAGVIRPHAELAAHAGELDGSVQGFVGFPPLHYHLKTGVAGFSSVFFQASWGE